VKLAVFFVALISANPVWAEAFNSKALPMCPMLPQPPAGCASLCRLLNGDIGTFSYRCSVFAGVPPDGYTDMKDYRSFPCVITQQELDTALTTDGQIER
jgi:hypothetical protein